MAKLLYGEPIALKIQGEISNLIGYYEVLHKSYRLRYGDMNTLDFDLPRLTIVKQNNDDASSIYVNNKMKFCQKCRIQPLLLDIDTRHSKNALTTLIYDNSNDPTIIQSPLHGYSNKEYMELLDTMIDYEIDVDKLTTGHVGKLWNDKSKLIYPNLYLLSHVPCTANAVYAFLAYYNYLEELKGKHAVIVGRSNLVGKPLAKVLLDCDMTVTVCHSKTDNLKEITSQADLLVVAVGKAKFITKEYVKEDSIIIDVGINRDDDGKLCGDVDLQDVRDKCKAITPVPKGVGVVTTAMVAANVLDEWTSNSDFIKELDVYADYMTEVKENNG